VSAKPTPSPVETGDVHFTVDQLARLAGTTTRTIRSFQTQGLLHHPQLRGRTGLYGQEHLDRLRAILRLQRAGFSLGAVSVLFDAWERGLSLERVLGLRPASDAHGSGPGEDADGLGAFDDWPTRRRGGGLAVVPTTVLDQVAS
jgi:DNA-binding transcriptional MerR regulator